MRDKLNELRNWKYKEALARGQEAMERNRDAEKLKLCAPECRFDDALSDADRVFLRVQGIRA